MLEMVHASASAGEVKCRRSFTVQADVVQVEAMAAAARHSGGISASVEK